MDVDRENDETINVAVSRAEEEFVLFTHKKFFIEANHNLKHLISYIETYGDKLDSNVNSIFAHLYKQMAYPKLGKRYDSLWEKAVHEALLNEKNTHKGFFVVMKQSLADVLVNEKYLHQNPELKKFALNRNTHIDFLVVSELNYKPILAIEVDGKDHKKAEQRACDSKKDRILKEQGIPVWRIASTDALEKDDVESMLDKQIQKFEVDLEEFLLINTWRRS